MAAEHPRAVYAIGPEQEALLLECRLIDVHFAQHVLLDRKVNGRAASLGDFDKEEVSGSVKHHVRFALPTKHLRF